MDVALLPRRRRCARRRVRRRDGDRRPLPPLRRMLGILWHNNTLLRTGREQRWYASLVEAVTAPPA